ncbi:MULTISPECIES: hypothetical protein [Clostridium]|jgi:hypothetical protein|uniref:Uncharacterized protein n=2 Tax=Clostridium butyricum TaxID=1492 RepID=C4IIV2_CLOBU|nr:MULTISPECIES: hypothetical protein [Clostridium]ETI90745.1 MAG: hypothetical protein Q607_CBUC00053G0049 [Clostridium butyricum DORA_1]ALP90170.1 hypothetical protein ATN24_08485 [Clostridium butyricum]ALS16624.1 hypothetical protein ATD26_07030 [Clostridium butyricum]ANF13788.1 hypothetical protein AZ909_06930 [Clostridium butyricum]AOR93855.1 hypothetical protein BBB49_07110 [Clostridium butyricum]
MNPYQLIVKVQQKIQNDPNFANKFNEAVGKLNKVPGLQNKVLQIAQISNDVQRQRELDKLPKEVKKSVEEILKLLEE